MDFKILDRAIGYGIGIILGYHLIGVFIPFLTWGVAGMVVIRIYLTYQNQKK